MRSTPVVIDPELLAAASALPRTDRTDVPATRRAMAARTAAVLADRPPDDGVVVEEHHCAGADGRPVALRLYRPRRPSTPGAVVHVHGGGFIAGDLETSRLRAVELARDVGCVVVAVDYRLAPEWPYPTPVEDVRSGLEWLHERAAALGIDPALIVLHGESAGGALVTAAALAARDAGSTAARLLFLTSPVLDDRLTTASSTRFTDSPALTRRDLEICWAAYLGAPIRGTDAVPPGAAPARAADLRGLPPTYLAVAEIDPLRDEALHLARSLLAADVPVELHLFPGTYHGSVAVRTAAVSRRQLAEEVAVLRSVLHPSKETDHV